MRRVLTALALATAGLFAFLPTSAHAQTPDFQCIGTAVGQYTKTVMDGAGNLSHVKLLSPAFNIGAGDGSFPIIWNAMDTIVDFSSPRLAGIAVNAYDTYDPGTHTSTTATQYVANAQTQLQGRPVYITETGMYDVSQGYPRAQALTLLQTQLSLIKANFMNIRAGLLFNSFSTNSGYQYNVMSDPEISQVCGGACGNIGINSATFFSQPLLPIPNFYDRAAGDHMGFTLEIANNDNNLLLPSVMPGILASLSKGMHPIIRIGVGNDSGGFTDPRSYVQFLQRVDFLVGLAGGGTVYAIAGPNEPNAEYWASATCGGTVPTPRPPQTPSSAGFTPLEYPCTDTTNPEFNPQRPYPGSPCDPLIPKKVREGDYLTFTCGKSLNVNGSFSGFPSAVAVASLPPYPGPDAATPGTLYRCIANPNEVCTIKRVPFDITLDLSHTSFPIINNTQIAMDDATKVNQYLNWYLSGSVQQANQVDLNPDNPQDMKRLVNFAGPVKKLLPKDELNILIRTLQQSPPVSTDIHNYLVKDPTRVANAWEDIFKDVPLSTLEDTVGEVTISLIPNQQPGNGSEPALQPGNGQVIPNTTGDSAITLTIKSPSDSRLYFSGLKETDTLAHYLTGTFQALGTTSNHTTVTDKDLLSDKIREHQDPLVDGTQVQKAFGEGGYPAGQQTRNTEVIENAPAPPPLFTDYGQTCEVSNVRVNPGDELMGKTISAHLSYTQFYHYQPVIVPTPDPGQPACTTGCGGGDCCSMGGSTSAPPACPGYSCHWRQSFDPVNTPCGNQYCSACGGPGCGTFVSSPSTLTFPTKASVATFIKTPLVENIYWKLVGGSQSLLRRFLPGQVCTDNSGAVRPCTDDEKNYYIKVGRDTVPGASDATYTGTGGPSDPNHSDIPQDPKITAGNDTSGGRIYFSRIGSLFDYILGSGTVENFNLQKMLRPLGFGSGALSGGPPPPSTTGGINCIQNLPADPASLKLCPIDQFGAAADAWLNRGKTYARECYGDVVERATTAGVDPGFALWIWMHESATSNYSAFTYPIQDFGINDNSIANNFSAQITRFLSLPNSYRATCAAQFAAGDVPMRIFIARYWTGKCDPESTQTMTIGSRTQTIKAWVDEYIAAINATWNLVSCGRPIPSYP